MITNALDHIIFVYGTLKRGCGSHYILRDAVFIGRARTRDYYALYLLAGGLPAVVKNPLSQIRGELFHVSNHILEKVDLFEGHPSFYRREEVVVIDEHNKMRNAFIYFYGRRLFELKHIYVTCKLLECGEYSCKQQ